MAEGSPGQWKKWRQNFELTLRSDSEILGKDEKFKFNQYYSIKPDNGFWKKIEKRKRRENWKDN